MPTAAILSQGNELVEGQLIDANAPWIATQLTALGLEVRQIRGVGDDLGGLASALKHLTSEHDVVVCGGGLGPTEDDLTAAAVAAAFHAPLVLDDAALRAIEARYAARGRGMPSANRKQAMFPRGAQVIPNLEGTAPGFVFRTQGAPTGGATHTPAASSSLFCLPGVPHELRAMFTREVIPELHALLAQRGLEARARPRLTFHTTGLGESAIQDRLGPWHGPGSLAYRCAPGRVAVTIYGDASVADPPSDPDASAAAARIRAALGPAIYAEQSGSAPGPSLAAVVGQALVSRGVSLSVAESCTGGQLAALCTDVPGASRWFFGGIISYHNLAKTNLLGVDSAIIDAHGAVSAPVARAMAEGARQRCGTEYSLAITGIAGPGGGTPVKPVGIVHLALATPEGTHHRRLQLGGSRATIQQHSAHAALDVLRRHLLSLPLPPCTP